MTSKIHHAPRAPVYTQQPTHQPVDSTPQAPASPGEATTANSPEVAPSIGPTAGAVATSRAQTRNDVGTQQMRGRIEAMLDGEQGPSESIGSAQSGQSVRKEGFTNIPGRGLTFMGTEGDDAYTVRRNPSKGRVEVRNDNSGETFSIASDQIAGLQFDLRGGNDTLRFANTIGQALRIDLGDGDDKVRFDYGPTHSHEILGGRGDDDIDARGGFAALTLDGGEGDDSLRGGSQNDTIRGGGGNDSIWGGGGHDQIRGGAGNDSIWGESGHDQIYGQEGDDQIYGQDGEDFVHGGGGRDVLDGGRGMDAIYGDETDWAIRAGQYFTPGGGVADDGEADIIVRNGRDLGQLTAGSNDVDVRYDRSDTEAWLARNPLFKINGSEEFRDRTIADLGAILTTNQGRGLLTDLSIHLRERGTSLSFEEQEESGGRYYTHGPRITVGNHARRYPADGSNRAPLPVLFHELVHARQFASGEYDRGSTRLENGSVYANIEFEATGLPYYDRFGRLQGADAYPYSDNRFRRELGLAERRAYGWQISPPVETTTPARSPYEAY